MNVIEYEMYMTKTYTSNQLLDMNINYMTTFWEEGIINT